MIKIVADKQKKLYELTYVLPADLTKSELETSHEVIDRLITKYKGEIKETQDWGKKDLAYKIRFKGKKHDQGIYTHLCVEFFPDQVHVFEKELLLLNETMRHLLVVAEKSHSTAEESVVRQQAPKSKKLVE